MGVQWRSIRLLGVRVDNISGDQVLRAVEQYVVEKRKAVIAHVNIQGMNLACQKQWYRVFLNRSEIVFCDGYGVKLAASLIGRPIQFRITYAEWMWDLAQYCQAKRISLFLLGARPGIAEKAAWQLEQHYPGLRIAGTHHGHFDKAPGSPENAMVIKKINAASPDVLVIGMGMPLQESWLAENWESVDATVALPGGAVFDYVSGELRRAPRWMTENGMEWLGRLVIEPRRLWKRYLIGNPAFFWRVLIHDVLGRPLPESGPGIGAETGNAA
jgi:N-acetylglucosaminyldiphosphoundecaprenol N-acetyl-beta-D-mannosaminyltransferase